MALTFARAGVLSLAFVFALGPAFNNPVVRTPVQLNSAAALALPQDRLHFGLANSPSDLGWMTSSGVPWRYRYQYLAAGVNTGSGWETWNSPAGQFATYYMDASAGNGSIPVFTYYELLQSTPSVGGSELDRDYSNLNNATTMNAYYKNFALLMQKAKAFGQVVVVHVEPDLFGYMEQKAAGGDASMVSASVASSGYAGLGALPNTFQGFGWALLTLRDTMAPNVVLAIHASTWASGNDIGSNTNPSFNMAADADKVAAFLGSAGVTANTHASTFDVVFNDVADHDAGSTGNWWDRNDQSLPDFAQWLAWMTELHAKTNRPLIEWQVPVGNQYFKTMNNTAGHFQDNRAEYFLSHTSALQAAGIIAVLFGSGNAGQTTYTDALGDGVTNPAPVTSFQCAMCNTNTSVWSDDDGGYLRIFVGKYYAASTLPGAPATPVAVAGEASATVSWGAASGTVVTYTVAASPGPATATSSGSVLSATVSGLTDGTAYTFTVTASNAAGTGPPSATSNTVVPGRGAYHALAPGRILDTRNATPLGAGASRNVQISGQGGVPGGAAAVVMNVTVTDTTAASYLTVWPAGVARPTASNLNWTAGQTVPNLVEVALGLSGQVSVYNNAGSTDVIFDVAGYVATPTATPPASGLYNPVVPNRVLDTRGATGAPVGAGQTINVTLAGTPALPLTGLAAVVLNVTATNPTAPSYLTVFPTGASPPIVSNLNFLAGQTVPNRVIVKVGSGGSVSFYNAFGSVDVIADVGGWFTDGTTAAGGSLFVGVTPTRILDTRTAGNVGPNATFTLPVAGHGGVPASGAAAVVLNLTVTNPTASSFLTAWPDGMARPLSSDLNYAAGQTVPNLVVVKLGANGSIDLYNASGTTDLIVDVVGWYQ